MGIKTYLRKSVNELERKLAIKFNDFVYRNKVEEQTMENNMVHVRVNEGNRKTQKCKIN
jgi:hypothetical protein